MPVVPISEWPRLAETVFRSIPARRLAVAKPCLKIVESKMRKADALDKAREKPREGAWVPQRAIVCDLPQES